MSSLLEEHSARSSTDSSRDMSPQDTAQSVTNEVTQDTPAYPSSITQFAKIIKLPGLIGAVGLPDIHPGYAFPIGSVAAIDLSLPEASISPEGVGYDINCGVRSLRTSLCIGDLEGKKDLLADALFKSIPSGVGGSHPMVTLKKLNGILNEGLKYLEEHQMIPAGERKYVESEGCLEGDSRAVSQKAKGRGLSQLGSLGAGNHYLEIQAVDEIYDKEAATAFGLEIGQILVSIHTGSRGLGHVVCSEFTERIGKTQHIPYHSREGSEYMRLMNSASNFAWANRAFISTKVEGVLKKIFPDVECKLIYDVAHNIAKVEQICVDGEDKTVLVHRKGASRAVPPGHPELPEEYLGVGQPVPVGGSMGTCSFILAGDRRSDLGWYSTCHGAGRILTRGQARKTLDYNAIVKEMADKGIIFRSGSEIGIVEEAPCCYKDIEAVVEISRKAGLTKTVARAVPIIVIKG